MILCHHGLAMEPLADSRKISRILKRGGVEWNGMMMFTGNDLLIGDEKINGQLFIISKRKEQYRIFPVIARQFHHFLLLKYNIRYLG
jgi:hypothetical protein